MKILILFVFLTLNSENSMFSMEIQEVRELYVRAAESEVLATRFYTKMESITVNNGNLLYGYKGVSMMFAAKYYFNPMSKLSSFNKGKSIIESAILKEPTNSELRFLRFSVQCESPAILGYRANIEEDRSIILYTIINNKLSVGSLRTIIINYLINSGLCSEKEKKQLKMKLV